MENGHITLVKVRLFHLDETESNRINRFIAQYGKCAVSGMKFGLNDWHCHHKKPYHLTKDDSNCTS